jgi:hypothetical protein
MQGYFQARNPDGYPHDLGAMDVFFDNFGMLVAEQFRDASIRRKYLGDLMQYLLAIWEQVKKRPVHQKPYWGKHFNSTVRRPNSGEPRGLLRLITDDNLSRFQLATVEGDEDAESHADSRNEMTFNWETGFRHPFRLEEMIAPDQRFDLHLDWKMDDLLPREFLLGDMGGSSPMRSDRVPGGVPLPPDWSRQVDQFRILPPQEATPDLPLRVGRSSKDVNGFENVIRDQGQAPTCAAHCLSVALDLLVQRKEGSRRVPRFSPAWIHFASGTNLRDGRHLRDVVDTVRERLPCEEWAFRYDPAAWGSWQPGWETAAMHQSSQQLTGRFGRPQFVAVPPADVCRIKTYLAAGWLVLLTTSLTDEMLSDGFQDYGLMLGPVVGQSRKPEGHAWLLAGYEHADGHQQWRYQGRFVALNSWGFGHPTNPAFGHGVCTIPFATLLTEGLEAFAVRLND